MAFAVVVSSGSGCSSFQGTTAASFLKRIEERDPNVRYKAYANLASPKCYDDENQKAQAVRTLVAKLEADKEPTATRAVICRTLGALGRPEARDVILRAVNDEDGLVRAEACRALGRVGRQEDATILARIMTVDLLEECRIAAIESLGDLKSTDGRIITYLAAAMEHDDPAIRYASHNALVATVGKDFGIKADDWKDYVRSVAGAAEPAKPDAIAAAEIEAEAKAKAAIAARDTELEPPSLSPEP
ncbi:HEAT repeat domain-containing protein [Tundrisphaera sp. TA3]|uniref:HEAT repeat domain-containing protein n=1 Tax=Tundrisphaera sp. TA3 TaxID=3435775 RepID=UPI003EBAD28C